MHDDPVESVVWMVRGAWVTMTLGAACRLKVFDALVEPGTAAEVARRTAADAATLERLLRALSSLGLLEQTRPGSYVDSGRGVLLCADHPSHLRDLVLMQSELPNVGAWHALDDAVRTGAGVYERVNGRSHWAHLAANPDLQRSFNASMARRAADQVRTLLRAIDFSQVSVLVDVGGGRGSMMAGLLHELPELRGVVADQPDVAAEARAELAAAGLADRAEAVGCDFFEAVPGGDVHTIANVLHDWDDDDCVTILRNVRSAMPDHGRLLVVEHVLDAPGRSFEAQRGVHLVDLHMLVMFGARERTKAQYDELLVDAGFTPGTLAATGTDWNVLEAGPTT